MQSFRIRKSNGSTISSDMRHLKMAAEAAATAALILAALILEIFSETFSEIFLAAEEADVPAMVR